MVPIGRQKGYTEETLRVSLEECAFFLVDVYGTGYSAGDQSQFGAILRRTHGLTDAERWRTERPEEFEYSSCVSPPTG